MSKNLIEWTYLGTVDGIWQGKSKGLLCHIVFTISLTHKLDQEYLICSNYKRILNHTCLGLAKSKELAQEILNSYGISLSIP